MLFFTLCECGHDRTSHSEGVQGAPDREYAGACTHWPSCDCRRFLKAPGQYYPWGAAPPGAKPGELPPGVTGSDAVGYDGF